MLGCFTGLFAKTCQNALHPGLQLLQRAELGGQRARQVVLRHIQPRQALELAQLGGNGAAQVVLPQVQSLQVLQPHDPPRKNQSLCLLSTVSRRRNERRTQGGARMTSWSCGYKVRVSKRSGRCGQHLGC